MMNKIVRMLICAGCVLSLTACVSTQDPGIDVADNTQIEQFDCSQIASHLTTAEKLVENLRKQRNLSHANNGVNIAAAVLNPFILLNAQWMNPKKVNEVLASYEERVQKLTERQKTLNCSVDAVSASAPAAN